LTQASILLDVSRVLLLRGKRRSTCSGQNQSVKPSMYVPSLSW